MKQVVELIRGHRAPEDEFALLSSHGVDASEVTQEKCEGFASALMNSGHASIDAFLNSNDHKPGYQAIGKAAIAQVLLGYEKRKMYGNDDDWLSYLFVNMLDGVNTPDALLRNNRISFVTFNYDRFLEGWLYTKIQNSFGIDDGEALAILRGIPIFHVYGMLGEYPNREVQDGQAWIRASKSIRTIYEIQRDHDILRQAKLSLEFARTICLLGFGFHRENIDILDLPKYLMALRDSGKVYATSFEIRPTEWDRYTKALSGIPIHRCHESKRCLEALRDLPVL